MMSETTAKRNEGSRRQTLIELLLLTSLFVMRVSTNFFKSRFNR